MKISTKIAAGGFALRVLAPVLGVVVLGLAATGGAQAQGKMKRQKSGGAKSGMSKPGDMSGGMSKDVDEYTDPAPIDYPAAAPGSIGNYHYKSYRGDDLVPGSITDSRMDKEMMRDKKLAMLGSKNMTTRDAARKAFADKPMMADPAPINYPQAAPGSMGVYTFSDYTATKIVEGSAEDKRMQRDMMRDKNMAMMGNRGMTMREAMRASYYDNPFMADPAPVNYPQAAPGSLSLYSFSDYTGNKIVEGSTTDRMADRDKMVDKQNMSKSAGKTKKMKKGM